MTDQRELNRVLGVFLATGTDELADRVIDAALDQIDHTPQRHALRAPWRFRTPTLYTRLAAAAVIGVMALYVMRPSTPAAGGPSPTPAPHSSPASAIIVGRGAQTATLLDDGRVLVAGGLATGGAALASADLFDPRTGTFSPTGSMGTVRGEHTATVLSDGRVLVAGGTTGTDSAGGSLSSAELYDPATGTFTRTGSMTDARAFHTATRLVDGRVLVTGGDGASAPLTSAEIYDPTSGTFSQTAPMPFGADLETATLLGDGRVLVAGGSSSATGLCFASAAIFDPKTGTFDPTGSMGSTRCGHTATLLQDGRVLMTTGTGSLASDSFQASAEIFDPRTGRFSPTGSMAHAPGKQTATLLTDGRVLIAGGNQVGSASLASAEIFDPTTGTFGPTGPMAHARTLHAAALLSDGRVLVIGGTSAGWSLAGPFLGSGEIYDPATGTFSPAS